MQNKRFANFAWFVLIFNLGVILWGAYVRATGSGAGCGAHWPLCNGEVIPRGSEIETVIELTHRLTSGIAFLLVVGLLLWSRRIYPKGHPVRLGTGLAMVFMVTEALVGAGLVLFEWVGDNASISRTVSIAVHLVNTFLLLAFLSLTGWWASGGKAMRISGRGVVNLMLLLGFLGLMLVGTSGAITALGDTLFPAQSLVEGIKQDLSPTAHFLIRLRVWHPILAVFVGLYLVLISGLFIAFRDDLTIRRLGWILIGLVALQLGAGVINLVLLAPIWMQLVHLFLADLVWIDYVILSSSV